MTPRRRGFVHASAWGLIDQSLISAANFATMVILARALRPGAFGTFVLAYSAVLVAHGIQTALITQPHNVVGQQRRLGHEHAYRIYTTATAANQVAFSACLAALTLAAAFALLPFDTAVAHVLAALSVAFFAWQIQEFGRRVLYTEQRVSASFASDLISYAGQVAVLLLLGRVDLLSPSTALYAIAATSFVGGAFAFWKVRNSLGRPLHWNAARENIAFGKWLGAAFTASWLSTQLYVFLTAALLGTTAAGGLRASHVVLGPLNTFFLFLVTILPIRFAATRERQGDQALHAELRLSYLVSAPPVIVICALVALFAEPLLRLFYGETYASYANVVVLLAMYSLVLHVVYLLTAALHAKRLTRPLFSGNVVAALVGIALGWPLITLLGVAGAAVGMILGAVVLVFAFCRAYKQAPRLLSSWHGKK